MKLSKDIIRTAVILFALIIVCALMVRFIFPNETLQDYADKNPEIAYATDSEETEPETETVDEASSENIDDSTSQSTVTYATGFFYKPLPDDIATKLNDNTVLIANLVYANVLYQNFSGKTLSGELICNKSIADDVMEIFYELYQSEYQFESIALTTETTSNNTICFSYGGLSEDATSKHAYGLAIDINPAFNPYVEYAKDGSGEISVIPESSAVYADRSKDFPYKIDENDLCYKLFTEHGFTWGGNKNSAKDYGHFEK